MFAELKKVYKTIFINIQSVQLGNSWELLWIYFVHKHTSLSFTCNHLPTKWKCVSQFLGGKYFLLSAGITMEMGQQYLPCSSAIL